MSLFNYCSFAYFDLILTLGICQHGGIEQFGGPNEALLGVFLQRLSRRLNQSLRASSQTGQSTSSEKKVKLDSIFAFFGQPVSSGESPGRHLVHVGAMHGVGHSQRAPIRPAVEFRQVRGGPQGGGELGRDVPGRILGRIAWKSHTFWSMF